MNTGTDSSWPLSLTPAMSAQHMPSMQGSDARQGLPVQRGVHVGSDFAAAVSIRLSRVSDSDFLVLCCFERAEDGHAVYHVHTAQVRRRASRAVGVRGYMVMAMSMMLHFHPHVVADGRIYWQPVKLPGSNGKVNNMLAFDTMAESFQKLLSPVEGPFLELFKMNSGALGLYHYRGGTADLWVLQDHRSWSWSMNHRIKLPGLVYSLLPVLDPEGDVLVLSDKGTSGILGQHLQHISGANGSLLARYGWSVYLKLRRHRFKENLVHQDFFSMEGNAGGVVEKPLFDGLSTVAVLSHIDKKRYESMLQGCCISAGWSPS